MTKPEDAADIADVVTDVTGERLAVARPLGHGAPVLAFDVGGTDIKSALFDADGTALGLRRTPTPVADGDRTEVLIERLGVLAAELRAEHPDVHLSIVGSGWWEDDLRKYVAEVGAGDLVSFEGQVTDDLPVAEATPENLMRSMTSARQKAGR